MADRRPLTLRTDVTPNRLQELPAGDQLPPDALANALAVVLQGLVMNNNAGITAADTVLQALGKLQAQANNKVDKDGSKVLSDNNYTNAERVKLANIGDSASNDRSKHTGTQAVSTITGLGSAATATVTTTPVDTTTGRLLKVGDFGVGAGSAPFYNGVDLNTLKISGTYGVLYPVNGPISNITIVTVAAHSPDWVVQTLYSPVAYRTYRRYFRDGTTWTAWVLIANEASLGNAAAATLQTGMRDLDRNKVAMVGSFGWGISPASSNGDTGQSLNATLANDMSQWVSGVQRYAGEGLPDSYGHMLRLGGGKEGSNGGWFHDLAFTTAGKIFERHNINENIWTPWVRVGEPSISGENANGAYAYFPDGTLICSKKLPLETFDEVSPGGVIQYKYLPFPVAFLGNPVSFSQASGGNSANNAACALIPMELNGSSEWSTQFFVAGSVPCGRIVRSFFAVGRWK